MSKKSANIDGFWRIHVSKIALMALLQTAKVLLPLHGEVGNVCFSF